MPWRRRGSLGGRVQGRLWLRPGRPSDSARRPGSSKSWHYQAGTRVRDGTMLLLLAPAHVATGGGPAQTGPEHGMGEAEGPAGDRPQPHDSVAASPVSIRVIPETRSDRVLSGVRLRGPRPRRRPPPAGRATWRI